ncbi:epididymal-specific lipocalin-12 isoform 2-T2 [Glossophaga mutica]
MGPLSVLCVGLTLLGALKGHSWWLPRVGAQISKSFQKDQFQGTWFVLGLAGSTHSKADRSLLSPFTATFKQSGKHHLEVSFAMTRLRGHRVDTPFPREGGRAPRLLNSPGGPTLGPRRAAAWPGSGAPLLCTSRLAPPPPAQGPTLPHLVLPADPHGPAWAVLRGQQQGARGQGRGAAGPRHRLHQLRPDGLQEAVWQPERPQGLPAVQNVGDRGQGAGRVRLPAQSPGPLGEQHRLSRLGR